jgi:hypothetical protein
MPEKVITAANDWSEEKCAGDRWSLERCSQGPKTIGFQISNELPYYKDGLLLTMTHHALSRIKSINEITSALLRLKSDTMSPIRKKKKHLNVFVIDLS